MKLTKSKYVTFCNCPRKSWLDLFDSKPSTTDPSRALMGQKIGKEAYRYFGNVTQANPKTPPTAPGIYAEYPLRFNDGSNDLECFCDILRINDDSTIDIFEVKSVNSVGKNDKEQEEGNQEEQEETEREEESSVSKKKSGIKKRFLEDVSFQYYVAVKAGFTVRSISLMHLNKNYVYDGVALDYQKLFLPQDVTDIVKDRLTEVETSINSYFALDKNNRVNCPLKGFCNDSECQYLEDCKNEKGLPKTQSVYDLYAVGKKKYDLIERGVLSFQDLIRSPAFEELSEWNKRMIIYSLQQINEPYVNEKELRKWLKKAKLPLYFFDFETVQEPIPVYPNSRPYQQIPFQYSLHVQKSEQDIYQDVVSNHFEYLGDGTTDPREALIQQMIKELGTKGKIVAYHASFEKSRIRELAVDFPHYAKELAAIEKRFIDLEDVFLYSKRLGWKSRTQSSEPYNTKTAAVYLPAMENSASIKHVLPAFFPNQDEFNYAKLDQVHRGDEASDAYRELGSLPPDQEKKLRKDMLKYCCLDTKAMVAIYFELLKLIV